MASRSSSCRRGTITISSGMRPHSTTVSGNYTFTGGSIAGGSLTKDGAGTLKIDGLGPNTYSGGTIMNGGTLHLGTIVNGISPLCTGTVGTGTEIRLIFPRRTTTRPERR
jgi:autotransporter-associated beta strand protein